MKYTEYRKEQERQYHDELKYWSNCCGDLHRHGGPSIKESELPEELLRAYNELWTEGAGSLCYLVEYKGVYGIALINEFDDTYASDINSSMDELYERMKAKADQFSEMEKFKTAQILIAEELGFLDCHEFVVILPCDTEKELFDSITNTLLHEVYA